METKPHINASFTPNDVEQVSSDVGGAVHSEAVPLKLLRSLNVKRALIKAFIVTIISFIGTFLILDEQWNTVGKIMISGVISILADVTVFVYEAATGLKRKLSEARHSRDYQENKASLLEKELQKLRNELTQLQLTTTEVSALAHVQEDEFVKSFRQQTLQEAVVLAQLVGNGRAEAHYREQLSFAAVFAKSATKYLWATSLDRLSEFQKRNYYYLQALGALPAELSGGAPSNSLPKVARIFVGRIQDFYEDILNESPKVLDLYEWHIRWLSDDEHQPIRFFAYQSENDYTHFFKDFSDEDRIEDFMIIDSKFVYGRWFQHAEAVGLANLHDEQIVKRYESLFPELWNASTPMKGLLEKMRTDLVINQEVITEFEGQCKNRESKLELNHDYGHQFTAPARRDMEFFKRVCQTISLGTGICFALDRADKKKTESFIATWERSPYVDFANASKTAAQHAAQFRRLFILEKWLPDPVEKIREFILGFVRAGMEVGFILASDASLGPLTEKYETDFIVVGIKEKDFKDLTVAFGFELQEAEFEIRGLSFEKDLIAKSRLASYYALFNRLWDATKIKVTSTDSVALDHAVSELRGGENATHNQ